MDAAVFSLEMKVRDYECDMQGIVNNAVYQNYLEWARHEYLLSRGLSFAELTARGVIIMITRAELDYRLSLQAGDSFEVSVKASHPS
ncbi:MAG: acyl-CoA thioesterase, partial [Gammaproteobacteria bacterium]|nr:acyl-CoA thioesterase [Gammaproteobacteria bacterium]